MNTRKRVTAGVGFMFGSVKKATISIIDGAVFVKKKNRAGFFAAMKAAKEGVEVKATFAYAAYQYVRKNGLHSWMSQAGLPFQHNKSGPLVDNRQTSHP